MATPSARPLSRLATFSQAAIYTQVGERTIRNWVAAGHLAAYRIRGRRAALIDLDEVDEVIPRLRAAGVIAPVHGKRYGEKARVVTLAEVVEDDR